MKTEDLFGFKVLIQMDLFNILNKIGGKIFEELSQKCCVIIRVWFGYLQTITDYLFNPANKSYSIKMA